MIFPNLLDRNFKSPIERTKLVTDITYLPTSEGFLYLSAVQDLYNNEIVAWRIAARNDLNLVFSTLEKLNVNGNAILHSDQGFQYTHKSYKAKLQAMNLQGSHSRKRNCLDNAAMESFFSHLKAEAFVGNRSRTLINVSRDVEAYIRFYNTDRFQKRLGQFSPVEYRRKLDA